MKKDQFDVEPLPKWMMRRYALMHNTYADKSFTLEQLADKTKEDKRILNVLLSRMRRMGWLTVEFDKDDARKRVYTLVPIQKVMEMMEK